MGRITIAGARWLAAALLAGGATAQAALVSVPAGASLNLPSGSMELACADLSLQGSMSMGPSTLASIGSITIMPGGTLNAGTGMIAVGGNWANFGTFSRGTGSVTFVDGCSTSPAQLAGVTAFANLGFASNTGRTLIIPSGEAIAVGGLLTLTGLPGLPVQIVSANPSLPSSILIEAGGNVARSNALLGPNVSIMTPVTSAESTDLNGDGKSDLLYRNATTGQVYRFLLNGLSIAGEALVYAEPDIAWTVIADADFTGDGVTDLLWRNASTGQFYLMPFDNAGMPTGGGHIYTEGNPAWKVVQTPDLDGDGKADFLWWNSNTGQLYAMLANGSPIGTQGVVYTEPNTAWRIAAAGDFAGSGRQNQLLWRNAATGQVFLMTVTVSGGVFGQTGQMIYQEANTAWKILAAADFNGDGRSDILWRNDSTGMVYAMLMDGASIAGEAVVYAEGNLAWKIVAQGDYDGDGKADLLWRNDTTGQAYMMLMNGLAIASQGGVYAEPNTAWKILGPWEYGQANGLLDAPLAGPKVAPSGFTGEPVNRGRIGGWPVNASPGLPGPPGDPAQRLDGAMH